MHSSALILSDPLLSIDQQVQKARGFGKLKMELFSMVMQSLFSLLC